MSEKQTMYSLQDFSLIKSNVDKRLKDSSLESSSLAFMFFMLDLVLNMQDDEIDDALTDTSYLTYFGKEGEGGHDRGIDAVVIDESESPATVHIFTFKYTEQFDKTQKFYPSNEIDKIVGFLNSVIQGDREIRSTINEPLFAKVNDIWNLFNNQNPNFVIHICANYYHGFESQEHQRFEREIGKFSNFSIEYHLIPWIVSRLTRQGKVNVNAKIKAIDVNLFEKSGGDIRALVVDVDARELLRIVIDNEELRSKVDLQDYRELLKFNILEDAFEDNVRVYLKQRSKINRNIKETALSEESHRFFYFNNGITITCLHFNYPKKVRAPIIEIEHLQIVNGGQTIHALFDAFKEDPSQFEDIDILCRIYETRNEELSSDIAECTNSQNPVKSRDIRSNDYTQKKLEKELETYGYFYERKKGKYLGVPKDKRIDAEKAGQAILAFYNKMPAEAKNKKTIIFGEKYEEIFTDQRTAESILLALTLYNHIEEKKFQRKREILANSHAYELDSFILHASYYLMFTVSELAELKGIEKKYSNHSSILGLYDEATSFVRRAVELEMGLDGYKDKYSHRLFFVGNRAKLHLESFFKESLVSATIHNVSQGKLALDGN